MVGLLLSLSFAFGAECSLKSPLDRAEEAILDLDLDGGAAALRSAKAALGCGSNSREDLSRYWLLVAAHADFSGDSARLEEALLAARSSSSSFFIEALGEEMKARWEAIRPAVGTATIVLADLPVGYTLRIDGQDSETGAVSPGLHVVQAYGGDQRYGRVVRAEAGDSIEITTELPPLPNLVLSPPSPVEPDLLPTPTPSRTRRVRSFTAVGVSLRADTTSAPSAGDEGSAFSRATGGGALDVGVLLRPHDRFWLRGTLQAEVSFNGSWVYEQGGTIKKLAVSPGLLIAGGISPLERLDLGLQIGQQLPGRLPLRLLGSYAVSNHLRVEVRGGMNGVMLTDRSVQTEPAASLHLTMER